MILASIKPYYYYLIGERKKTIEVRKTALKNLPQDIAFYMSKDEKSFAKIPKEFQEKYRKHFGKVGMRVICYRVIEWKYLPDYIFPSLRMYYISVHDGEKTCLSYEEIEEYGKGKTLYGWHIYDLKIYDKPKPIMQFYKPCPIKIKNCPVCELYSTYTGCCMNNIDRPPQSYMFVEEVEQ